MRIEILIRDVYGNALLYPANQAARDACELLGVKTLNNRQLALLERLGHEIVERARNARLPEARQHG